MGADSWAENTPNAPEFICPICLLKPKSSGFQWKKASLDIRSPCYLRSKKQQASLIRSLLKYGIGKGFWLALLIDLLSIKMCCSLFVIKTFLYCMFFFIPFLGTNLFHFKQSSRRQKRSLENLQSLFEAHPEVTSHQVQDQSLSRSKRVPVPAPPGVISSTILKIDMAKIFI